MHLWCYINLFLSILKCEKLFILIVIGTMIIIQCKVRGLNRLILARVGSPHYAVDATDLSSNNIPLNLPPLLLLLVLLFLLPLLLLLPAFFFSSSPFSSSLTPPFPSSNSPPAHPLA